MNEESKELLSAISDLLDSRMEPLKKEITEIKLTLENVTNKNIQLLVEGHNQNAEKLNKLERIVDGVETIKTDVDIVKAVVTTHSKQLKSS